MFWWFSYEYFILITSFKILHFSKVPKITPVIQNHMSGLDFFNSFISITTLSIESKFQAHYFPFITIISNQTWLNQLIPLHSPAQTEFLLLWGGACCLGSEPVWFSGLWCSSSPAGHLVQSPGSEASHGETCKCTATNLLVIQYLKGEWGSRPPFPPWKI